MAFVLRSLLECEMHNVNAKKYRNTYDFNYKDGYYKDKYESINSLVGSLLNNNPDNIVFGFQKSDTPPAKYIMYFQHPYFGQVSFHTDISSSNMIFLKPYKDKWDGRVDSTFFKLFKLVDCGMTNNYGEIPMFTVSFTR